MKNKETILVLEDEAIILVNCKSILQSEGYNVKGFTNFNIGLEVYRELFREINFVLLDMHILDLDYLFTIPALVEINPKIKIIAMSGTLELDNLSAYYQSKIIGFLEKPFEKDELLAVLKKVPSEI